MSCVVINTLEIVRVKILNYLNINFVHMTCNGQPENKLVPDPENSYKI